MNESWIALILVGIAASLMPLTIGVEIYALGTDKGVKKVLSLIGGVTIFRILITVGAVLLFAGVIATQSENPLDVGQILRTMLSEFNEALTPEQRLAGNLLLLIAGVLIIIQIIRLMRSKPPKVEPSSQPPDSRAIGVGIGGMLWIGFLLTATNVNQYVLIPVGVNQILRMESNTPERLLAYVFFLALSIAAIMLPFLIFLIRPQHARSDLETLNRWINNSMRYIMMGIFFLVGLYFVWKGGVGVMNYLSL